MPKPKKPTNPQAQAAFEAAMERIKSVTGARTQVQLAELLDVRQSSISDAKRRCSIPPEWQLKLLESHGLLPRWIRTGEGPQYLAGAAQALLHEHRVRLGLIEDDYVRLVMRMEQHVEILDLNEATLREKQAYHAGAISVELAQNKALCAELATMADQATEAAAPTH